MATGTYDRERELTAAMTPAVESALPGVEVLAVELLSPARFCVYVDHPDGVDIALCERVTRLLDDFAYQAVVRTDSGPSLFPDIYPMADDAQVATAERVIREELSALLETMLPADGVTIAELTLPWRRSFEIGLVLR